MCYNEHMTAILFDTLKFSAHLKASGFSEEQAQGVTSALTEAFHDKAVTPETLRQELQLLESRMTVKLGSMIIVATTVLAAINFFAS